MPQFLLFLRCPFQIQDRKREGFLRYSVCISAAGGDGIHRVLGDPGLASRKPKWWAERNPQCAPVGLCSLDVRTSSLQDTCELHPPLRCVMTTVGIPRMCEVCWGSHMPCSLQTANIYYMSFINHLRLDWRLPAPVSKVLWRLSIRFLPLCCDRQYRTENLPPMLTYFDAISKTPVFYKNWS